MLRILLLIEIVAASSFLECSIVSSMTFTVRLVQKGESVYLRCFAFTEPPTRPQLQFESKLNLTVYEQQFDSYSTWRIASYTAPLDDRSAYLNQNGQVVCRSELYRPCFFTLVTEFEPFIDPHVPTEYDQHVNSTIECPIRAMPYKYKIKWNDEPEQIYSKSSAFYESKSDHDLKCQVLLDSSVVKKSDIKVKNKSIFFVIFVYVLVAILVVCLAALVYFGIELYKLERI
jgi:hypothetical protein